MEYGTLHYFTSNRQSKKAKTSNHTQVPGSSHSLHISQCYMLIHVWLLHHSRKRPAWWTSARGRPCCRWTTSWPTTRTMTTFTSVWTEKTAPASSAALTTAAQVPGARTGCTCGFLRSIRTHEYFSPLRLASSTWSTGSVICTYKQQDHASHSCLCRRKRQIRKSYIHSNMAQQSPAALQEHSHPQIVHIWSLYNNKTIFYWDSVWWTNT